jgi:hypothetical protein
VDEVAERAQRVEVAAAGALQGNRAVVADP